MLRTVKSADYDLSKNHRLIFVGDIHGSFDPLECVPYLLDIL
jgi:hypothetical protein